MSEMIERVARAILCALKVNSGGSGYVSDSDHPKPLTVDEFDAFIGGTTIDGRFDVLLVARAAIEAMREPTAQMQAAARGTLDYQQHTWDDGYRTMIDAALPTPKILTRQAD